VVPGRVCKFPPSVPFHQCSILICTCMLLLLPVEETCEAWQPSTKQCFSEFGERWMEKNSFCCSVMGSVPQNVPCTQRRPERHWRFTRQTLDTNTNDGSSSDACTEPRNMSRVSHFLTSCSQIWFVRVSSPEYFKFRHFQTTH